MDEQKPSGSVSSPHATAEKIGKTILEKIIDKTVDGLILIVGPVLLGLLAYFHALLPRPITLPLWKMFLLFGAGGGFGGIISFLFTKRTLNKSHQKDLEDHRRQLGSVNEEFEQFRIRADQEAAVLRRDLDLVKKQLGVKATEADTDELTGLLNSRACQRRLQEQFTKEELGSEQPVTIIIIDLDNFKTVNDQDSRLGDLVLHEFATNLREQCRRNEPVFRYKVGDEFLVLALNTEADPAGRGFANRLRNFFANYEYTNPYGGDDFKVTISAGVADANPSPELRDTPERLMARAEAALRKAKLKGKNTIEVYWSPS
jgi:diguanylate cyclase (GGDEF)-like protein